MRSGYLFSLVAAAVLISAGGGCAGVKPGATNTDGGGTSGNPGTGGSLPQIDARPGIDGLMPPDQTKCGNGMQDPNEQCDDGNKTPGDGCSAICQVPSGWSCTG